MKCYYGEIHSHTTESDGRGTPSEAYDYARNVGKVDFFAVTDHHFQLKTERFASLMPSLSKEKNDEGLFAALYGYEMSYTANTGYYGHLNLYGESYVNPKTVPLGQWYDRIAKSENDIFGQFNHPGEKWGDFNEFAYDERIDKIFDLIELRIDEYGIPVIEEEYERCLSKGWHVGPLSNEDTHNGNFTTAREETGAVLAEELTAASIADAMKRRRTFATTDRTFAVFYTVNGHWLGDVISKTGKLKISVECSTEKDCGIGILQVVGENNTVLAQIDTKRAKEFKWELTLPDDHRYFYVRRMCGTHYAVTAPVWVEQPSVIELSSEAAFSKNGTTVTANIKNISNKDITSLTVSYYAVGGRIELSKSPNACHLIGHIDASKTFSDSYTDILSAAQDRIKVTVSGECDGMPFYVSDVIYVCPIGITQAFMNTAMDTVDTKLAEPLNCFDIHNFSDIECNLSEYTFRIYPSHVPKYSDIIIDRMLGAHKTLTVWFRGDEELDISDFNEAFGTSLDSSTLYPVNVSFPCPAGARKILICYGDRTVCRTWFRDTENAKMLPIEPFKSFVYKKKYEKYTSECIEMNASTLPGKCASIAENTQSDKFVSQAKEKAEDIGKLIVLCDGGDSVEAINNKILKEFDRMPDEILLGTNDRSIWIDEYFRKEGEKLLIRAGESDADTVILMLGGCDCGRNNGAWLDGSNIALPIVCEAAALYLQAKGKRIIFLTPSCAEAFPEDMLRLQKGLNAAYKTVKSD